MPLSPGSRLGPYEILAVAGAGGMGEVYRARDTRLGREVAIKVLPEHLSGDPGRRERFEREARAVSALNHPHICVLYDIGSEGGADYIVMEHLEGETIADRLLRGALPPDQVLRYAAEIADALAKAHRQGIVHRDLKPANVMITRAGAKLLDFGLAKLRDGDGPVAPNPGRAPGSGGAVPGVTPTGSMLPTATRNLTTAGTLLGTFQYMAPEQLEGKDADARTDIFAFGSLVYEMTTGRRAFEGGSQASLIASIMGKEPPPIAALAPVAPPALERIVRRCLAKDPDDRWQSAGDLAHALRELAGIGSVITSGAMSASSGGMSASGVLDAAAAARAGAPVTARRGGVPMAVAAGVAVVLAAATGFGAWMMRPAPAPRERLRVSINLPASLRLDSQNMPLAFSPDGRSLAMSAAGPDGRPMLYVRGLDARDAQPLAGTEGATSPFWSPDGRYIGFFADRKLKKIPASGGTVVSLCDIVDGRGASWGSGGVIVFSPSPFGGLSMVGEAGGAPTAVTTTDQPSVTHRLPWFLPGGRRFLYFNATTTGAKDNAVHVFDLDTKKDQLLIKIDSGVRYAAPGWITFVREQNLMAQRFDPSTLTLSGEAIPIAEGVRYNPPRWAGTYAVSDQGILVYQVGVATLKSHLTWFDLEGRKLGTVGEPAPMFGLNLSPDGRRAAVARIGSGGNAELYIVDLARGVATRFSFGIGSASFPQWSPDGERIAYADGDGGIVVKRSDGTGDPEQLITQRDRLRMTSFWTRDGASIFFRTQSPGTGLDLEKVSMEDGHAISPLVVTPANETEPSLSPDGRWLAYRSDESGGTMQLFIVPYPAAGGKWQVTSNGAAGYQWMPDGRSIVYMAPDRKLFSVSTLTTNGRLELGAPVPFFGGEPAPNGLTIAPDGKRILAAVPIDEGPTAPLELVTEWAAGLSEP